MIIIKDTAKKIVGGQPQKKTATIDEKDGYQLKIKNMYAKQKINEGADTLNRGTEKNNEVARSSGTPVQISGGRDNSERVQVLGTKTEGSGVGDSTTTEPRADRPDEAFGFKNFIVKQEHREKKTFYASDFGKATLDLYFSLTGEPATNQMKWDDTIRLEAGNGVEKSLVKILKDSGFVPENYEQLAVESVREGVTIHGRIDAIMNDGTPIEIKSINNKNVFDISNYTNNEPRESYVGQLAIYMDALGKEKGYLFAVTLDGLNKFIFPCYKTSEGKYRCGKVEVDIQKEYKRWAKIWNENIVPRKIPDVWEYTYKPDINKIDWKKVPLPKRRAAVNDGVVVGGDWHINYSPWKNKIVALQGTTVGYNDEEKAHIKKILLTLFGK